MSLTTRQRSGTLGYRIYELRTFCGMLWTFLNIKTTNELDGDDKKYKLCVGDLLIVEGHADPLEIGRTGVWRHRFRMLHQNHVIRARCRDPHSPGYICAIINSPVFPSTGEIFQWVVYNKLEGNRRLPLPAAVAIDPAFDCHKNRVSNAGCGPDNDGSRERE